MCRLVRVPLQPELVGVGVQGDGGQSAAGLVHQERGLDIEGHLKELQMNLREI